MARRRSRRRNSRPRLAVILGGSFVLLILMHAWVIVIPVIVAAIVTPAAIIAIRRSGPAGYGRGITRHHRNEMPRTGTVLYHAEMPPAELAKTRQAQRPKVIALGPNATAADVKAYNRDNPAPAAVNPDDEIPPF